MSRLPEIPPHEVKLLQPEHLINPQYEDHADVEAHASLARMLRNTVLVLVLPWLGFVGIYVGFLLATGRGLPQ